MQTPSQQGPTDYRLEEWTGKLWLPVRCYRAEDDDHALDYAEDYLSSRPHHAPGPFRIIIVTDYFVMHRSGTAARTVGPRFDTG